MFSRWFWLSRCKISYQKRFELHSGRSRRRGRSRHKVPHRNLKGKQPGRGNHQLGRLFHLSALRSDFLLLTEMLIGSFDLFSTPLPTKNCPLDWLRPKLNVLPTAIRGMILSEAKTNCYQLLAVDPRGAPDDKGFAFPLSNADLVGVSHFYNDDICPI
jgi:hypothetical protein